MKGVLIGRKVLDRFLTALTILYARVYASYSERSDLKLQLFGDRSGGGISNN